MALAFHGSEVPARSSPDIFPFAAAGSTFQRHDSAALRPLGAWMFLAVALNILLATAYGMAGDLAYWVDWTSQLANTGYANLIANYPPVYLHWLRLVGQFDLWQGLTPAANSLMRFFANTPVLLAHVGLVALMARMLRKTSVSDRQWNLLIAFTVLNPALLLDGPIWGQVDTLFCLFIGLALWLLIEGRALLWVLPLFALAVLTKLQAICVAPIVLPLLYHRRSKALFLGILPAAALVFILLLPFSLVGATGSMIDQAYLKAASLYPIATFHADNLWYLLNLDMAPDNSYIFDHEHQATGWQRFFTVKPFGIFLFSVWSLILLISSWRRDDASLHWRNATLSALGFFLWLPGMHERYMFPTVVLALLSAAHDWRCITRAAILTSVVTINLLFYQQIYGRLLPYAVAAFAVSYAIAVMGEKYWARLPWRRSVSTPLRVWAMLACIVWSLALGFHVQRAHAETKADSKTVAPVPNAGPAAKPRHDSL